MDASAKKPALLTPELCEYIERMHQLRLAEQSAATAREARLREAWQSSGGRAFRRFVDTRPSTATRRVYRQHLEDFLDWVGQKAGRVDVFDVTPEHLARYESELGERLCANGERKLSLRTRQDRIRTIRTAYKFCVDEELIDRSPARHLRVRGRAEPKRTFLSDGSASALVRACAGESITDVRDRSLLVFILHTGLRAAEAAGLTWSCISSPPGTSVTVEGKGRVVRTVPVSDEALAALKEWRQCLARPPAATDYVWRRLEHRIRSARSESRSVSITGFPLSAGTVYMIVKKRAVAARLDGVTPHTLRRTFATKLKRLGVALDSIQRFLGHASILTTAGYFDPHDESALATVRDLRYQS